MRRRWEAMRTATREILQRHTVATIISCLVRRHLARRELGHLLRAARLGSCNAWRVSRAARTIQARRQQRDSRYNTEGEIWASHALFLRRIMRLPLAAHVRCRDHRDHRHYCGPSLPHDHPWRQAAARSRRDVALLFSSTYERMVGAYADSRFAILMSHVAPVALRQRVRVSTLHAALLDGLAGKRERAARVACERRALWECEGQVRALERLRPTRRSAARLRLELERQMEAAADTVSYYDAAVRRASERERTNLRREVVATGALGTLEAVCGHVPQAPLLLAGVAEALATQSEMAVAARTAATAGDEARRHRLTSAQRTLRIAAAGIALIDDLAGAASGTAGGGLAVTADGLLDRATQRRLPSTLECPEPRGTA